MQDNKRQSGVDKGLIAMFIKMSVDERLLANDNACKYQGIKSCLPTKENQKTRLFRMPGKRCGNLRFLMIG